MTTPLDDLADGQFAQALHLHTTWQTGARWAEEGGVLLHQGALPLPIPFMNCVLRLDPGVAAASVVAQADAFFGGSANPYAVITQSRHDADLQAHLREQGFTLQSNIPAMLSESPVSAPQPDARWRIEPLSQAEQIPGFIRVCAQAYASLGLPAALTPAFFQHAQGLLGPQVSIALATGLDGQAVACAMALHTGEVAGLYWVGTLPEARGAGLAAACTASVTRQALDRGARAVVLQASPMGEAIYRSLGFREYARMMRWSR